MPQSPCPGSSHVFVQMVADSGSSGGDGGEGKGEGAWGGGLAAVLHFSSSLNTPGVTSTVSSTQVRPLQQLSVSESQSLFSVVHGGGGACETPGGSGGNGDSTGSGDGGEGERVRRESGGNGGG